MCVGVGHRQQAVAELGNGKWWWVVGNNGAGIAGRAKRAHSRRGQCKLLEREAWVGWGSLLLTTIHHCQVWQVTTTILTGCLTLHR